MTRKTMNLRTIIAGSRGISRADFDRLIKEVSWTPSVVLSGRARGVDTFGEEWAISNNIPVETFPADWHRLGRMAGFIRNVEMANEADALIAFWDGKSKGTKHMIDIAIKRDPWLMVKVFTVSEGDKTDGR